MTSGPRTLLRYRLYASRSRERSNPDPRIEFAKTLLAE